MTVESRGTSNTNDRGSAEARRKRKTWLFDIWGADVDVVTVRELRELVDQMRADGLIQWQDEVIAIRGLVGWVGVHKGLGRPAVRCFRCGRLCDWDSVEIDRIKPGAEGGRYTKSNIRPVCGCCNKILAGEWVKKRNAKRAARNQRRRDLKKKCGRCGAVPAAGYACSSTLVNGKWVTTWYCHPDEGVSCYSGDVA